MILAVIFITLFASAAVLFALTPKYTATAKILVDTSYKDVLNPSDQGGALRNEGSARVDSEVEILRSDNAITQLIKDKNLVTDPEFGISVGLTEKLLSVFNLSGDETPDGDELLARVLTKVKKAVNISRQGLTYIISVSVTSRDPKKAADLANSLVHIYISQQVQSKISTTIDARNVVQSQIQQANAALATSERRFDQYLDDNLPKFADQSNSAQIRSLKTQLEDLKKNAEEKSGVLDAALARLNNDSYSELAETLKSDAIAELERQREALTSSLDSAEQGSQKAVDLRAELARIDADVKKQARQEVNSLQSEVSSYQNQASDVRQELRTSVLSADLPPEVLADIYTIRQESEIARNQYQNLLSRLKELDTQAQLQLADSRVVNEALAPATPSFPNKGLVLGLAFVASLGLGFGIAFLREYFIGGFVSDEQIENVLRIPLAAVIGKQPDDAQTEHGLADVVIASPMSQFSESIRKIRVRIERLIFERMTSGEKEDVWEGLVILVTSSVPNEGKSTVSLSLSRMLAHSGKRTLLIDGDLRKPSVHKGLGLAPSSELHNFLTGSAVPKNISSLAVSDPMSPLRVILGGRTGTYATDELVMGERFARLISIAKRHFDYIVIDSPPLEPVVDGLYLARNSDIVTFVVRWGSTSQNVAKKSVNALGENIRPGTQIVGVMNQKSVNKAQSYYKYSGYYTDEGSDS
ncbi:AAA family ATPase [Rhizobium sp. L1K21]|nr:AAA family ATPase [Rhizobium sp. L1K21]